uniref:Uncharacterized protein n=1 Tax=Eutreptiella gymnastica TaxID=73025 RepID=A0A6U8GJZ8_9EUGL
MEQTEVEDDLLQWLGKVQGKWGSADSEGVLSRIGEAMKKYVGIIRKEGKNLDWGLFAQLAAMELTCHEDDEFDALMEGILDFAKPGVTRGSSEQEAQLRSAIVTQVAKSSTAERKEDIAKAFESAVGDGGQAKKATDAFLADRAGNLPAGHGSF